MTTPPTDTVLLLHSSASSSHQWQALMQQLQAAHRVIAVDLHGMAQQIEAAHLR